MLALYVSWRFCHEQGFLRPDSVVSLWVTMAKSTCLPPKTQVFSSVSTVLLAAWAGRIPIQGHIPLTAAGVIIAVVSPAF